MNVANPSSTSIKYVSSHSLIWTNCGFPLVSTTASRSEFIVINEWLFFYSLDLTPSRWS